VAGSAQAGLRAAAARDRSNGAACYDLASAVAYDFRAFDVATLPGLLAEVRAALPTARVALETATGMFREPDYVLSPFDSTRTIRGGAWWRTRTWSGARGAPLLRS